MNTELQESYRYCARVARTQARNFYFGFRVLPPRKQRSMYAIYAFMRTCDDIADDAPPELRAAGLRDWRRRLDAALSGDCGGNPVFPAFRDTVQYHHIPAEYFHALIDGAEMDLGINRYPTFDALYQYCYRVASVVGLVCLYVFGFREEQAKLLAEHCGIAFQLTNILRDVGEDAAAGRIYLPQEDLERFGYSEEQLLDGVRDERFQALMAFEAARARQYYRDSEGLVSLIDADSRACLAAMRGIYQGLLERLEQTRFNVYAGRTRLSHGEKLSIMAKAWWRYHGGRGNPPSQA